MAVAAAILALVSLLGVVIGGLAALSTFAVGAAHVALQQLRARGERGAFLAYAALIIGYAAAAYALLWTLIAGGALLSQLHISL